MRYGIISDIHGNREALESSLTVLYESGIDRLVCLGDIVGYGAEPDACVTIIRRHADVTVIGNHDAAAVGRFGLENANALAQKALHYSVAQLSQSNADWLHALPYVVKEGRATFCHGAPFNSENFEYAFSLDKAAHLNELYETLAPVTFIGHSHLTAAYLVTERLTLHLEQAPSFQLRDSVKYVFNVGSIGQPRDRDQRSCCVLWDTDVSTVTYLRIAYDIESAARKIDEASLPRQFSDRLFYGM
jgi:predicted phosphodiesterase